MNILFAILLERFHPRIVGEDFEFELSLRDVNDVESFSKLFSLECEKIYTTS